ncbi:MAG: glycosyltransferase family 1 protein [Candidatus Promineifilaceae bacterium]
MGTDKRARIGIDVTSALTQGAGIGRYTRELVRAVVAEESGHTFHLFSARLVGEPPVPNPLPDVPHVVYRPAPLGERWLYRLWYRLRLPLPVQWVTGELDLFHSPDFVLPPVNGRIPTLLTVHDLSFIHYPHVFPKPLVDYLNRVVPWSVRRATHILADSASTQEDLMRLWGVPAEKITVLYCGVSPQYQPITDAARLTAVRQKYALGDLPFVLSVGTVQPRKNYKMLIRAFKGVAEKLPHALYIAGGTGWMHDEILAEIENQGLNGRVRFLGFVDDADLPALYSAADLFVYPSLYEGFGLPPLEAMACGTPAILSNTSSLPEVAGEDGAVLLPPQETAVWQQTILTMLQSPQKREKVANAGRKQSQKFTWQQAAKQLLTLYNHLLFA